MAGIIWLALVLLGVVVLVAAAEARHLGAPAWVVRGLLSVLLILSFTIGMVWPTGAA